jgi:hypothetical protein
MGPRLQHDERLGLKAWVAFVSLSNTRFAHLPEVVLGMLVKVLCLNHVAACGGLAGKRHVPFMALAVGSAAWTLVGGSLRGPSGPILHCYFNAPLRQAAVDLQP